MNKIHNHRLFMRTGIIQLIRRACHQSQHQNFENNPHSSGKRYEQHVPTTTFQKSLLTVGSAFTALNDPFRGDMVAILGETTGKWTLQKLRLRMLNDETGSKILSEKPILNSEVLDIERLLEYPKNTLGFHYAHFMHSQDLSSETRIPVRFVDNAELAYIIKRYRQIHDFCHVILGFPVSVPGELVVKWFEWFHFGLPMAGLSSVFGPLSVSSQERTQITTYIPWAAYTGLNSKLFLNVDFEHKLECDMKILRRELGINEPPTDGVLHTYW